MPTKFYFLTLFDGFNTRYERVQVFVVDERLSRIMASPPLLNNRDDDDGDDDDHHTRANHRSPRL